VGSGHELEPVDGVVVRGTLYPIPSLRFQPRRAE